MRQTTYQRLTVVLAAVLGGAVLGGCKDDSASTYKPAPDSSSSSTPTTPATPTTQPLSGAMEDATGKMNDAAGKMSAATQQGAETGNTLENEVGDAAANLKDKAADATSNVKEKGGNLLDRMKSKAGEAADKAETPTTPDDAEPQAADEEGGAMATMKATAQKYYDEAQTAIKNKDFSKARAAVEKLEGIKGKLPQEWQTKVDSLKSMLDTAEKAGGSLPSLGGNE